MQVNVKANTRSNKILKKKEEEEKKKAEEEGGGGGGGGEKEEEEELRDPDDEGSTMFRNVGNPLQVATAQHLAAVQTIVRLAQ